MAQLTTAIDNAVAAALKAGEGLSRDDYCAFLGEVADALEDKFLEVARADGIQVDLAERF